MLVTKIYTYFLLLVLSTVLFTNANAQSASDSAELLISNLTDLQDRITGDVEIDEAQLFDDFFLVHEKVKLNINTADSEAMGKLHLLSVHQIQSLLRYKQSFGRLIDVHELQSVPFWDSATITRILPFIVMTSDLDIIHTIKQGSYNSRSNCIIRSVKKMPTKDSIYSDFLSGSPMSLSIKYKNMFGSALQFGFVADKDPGEQLFKGTQKKGFDFYSFHLFLKNKGVLKSLALGDFTVNIGQGLICWQSMAFRKTASMLVLKKQSPVIKPYCSFAENNFERGAGISLQKNKSSATIFFSKRKLDAHLFWDSTRLSATGFTSIQTTGLHRTIAEIEQKNNLSLSRIGASFSQQFGHGKISVNGMSSYFNIPKIKDDQPLFYYSFAGNRIQNYGVDFSFSKNNKYVFGEIASSGRGSHAQLLGMLVSIAPKIDFGFLYRNISKKYWSLGANAVTENQDPMNEKGILMQLLVKLDDHSHFLAYADHYQFPWLTYAVNSPSFGKDYSVLFNNKRKLFEFQTRIRFRQNLEKENQSQEIIKPTRIENELALRCQIKIQLSTDIRIQNRVELRILKILANPTKQGILFSSALNYHKSLSPVSLNFHIVFFETEDFATRIYHYDNDLRYSSSIKGLYGKGYYLSSDIRINICKSIETELKYDITKHFMPQSILTPTISDKSHEIKLQMICSF